MLLRNKNSRVTTRMGATYVPPNFFLECPTWTFTSSINFLLGKKHFAESGVGLLYANGFYSSHDRIDNHLIISSTLYLMIRLLGYRYERPGGGLFFNVGLDPIFIIDEYNSESTITLKYLHRGKFWPTIGIGLGRNF
jgi:hypothetical protein